MSRPSKWLTFLLVASLCGPANSSFAQTAGKPPPAETHTGPADLQHVDVKGVFGDSLKLLALQHFGRIAFQEKTRRELDGPFWNDYTRSVRVPGQWSDTDDWFVNYVGHPIQGAAAGYIWLDHDPKAARGNRFDRGYWASRSRAVLWSAVYGLQFEVGPLSEASIGNVGMRPETTGWADYVITPVGAFALIVAEDVLDRTFLRWVESRTTNRYLRGTLRTFVTPGRSLSNIASTRPPWYRDERPLGWK
jgi:hypothetical protein